MKKVKSRMVKSRLHIANRVPRSLAIDDSNHSDHESRRITS